jgi:hypothetical protein
MNESNKLWDVLGPHSATTVIITVAVDLSKLKPKEKMSIFPFIIMPRGMASYHLILILNS